jgi:peptidoglycan/xylan/chitin deacetylase (PgdA/CDA1 family)
MAQIPVEIPARFVALVYHDVHPGETYDYGRIGRSATMYHIPERAFRSQLDVIEGAGLRCLDEAGVRACLAGQGKPDDRGVVLSFDDGWRGAVEVAAPALAERRMPAFFFIATGLMGRRHFAAAAQWRALDLSLFTIGSHGVTHRMLSDLSPGEIRAELRDSRRTLEDLLERPVRWLSIPGGAVSRRVVQIAEAAGYDGIFTSALGTNPTGAGRRGIARVGVRRATDLATLGRWLSGDLRRERARDAILAVPKRLLGMRMYSKVRRALLGEAAGREQHFFEP